ncbi:protein of unknown function (plasmid) [Methylocella tundrae]|uniref:Uncharacterized protein n=1 Tax=Methylocella tundrae TaxID=227605 RepID=A0A4U8Z8M1_METTU|nr:hypothetical protein [Methylocella tundrae]VFU17509.1 protein of unknown function [Methylocella tundrae]
MSRLTSEQSFLLKWLEKEESSALGECEGQALTMLINLGLAEIKDTSDGPWRVSLTQAGYATLAEQSS